MTALAVNCRVEIRRKGRVRYHGTCVDYDPHDGYIGNPEQTIVIAVDELGGTLRAFRAPADHNCWEGRAKDVGQRRLGFVQIHAVVS